MQVKSLPGEFELDILVDEEQNPHVQIEQVLAALVRSKRKQEEVLQQFLHAELEVYDVFTLEHDGATWVLASHLCHILQKHKGLNVARVKELFAQIDASKPRPPMRKRPFPEISSSSEQPPAPLPQQQGETVSLDQLTR